MYSQRVSVGILRISDQVILDPFAHLHDIFLKFLRPAGKILVNHRLAERVQDGEHHCAVLARRVLFLVVLRPDAASVPIEFNQGFFPAPRNAIRLHMQYRYAAHCFSTVKQLYSTASDPFAMSFGIGIGIGIAIAVDSGLHFTRLTTKKPTSDRDSRFR